MTILKKLIPNLLLSLYFFIPTALGHKAYTILRLNEVDALKLEKYVALFIGIFIFSFIKNKTVRFVAMGFVLILSFAQFVHLEFYGLPIYPAEILLLFTQGGEIWGTVSEDYEIFFLPILLSLIPAIILFFVNKKVELKIGHKLVSALFIFYLIYNPLRTYITGNTWGRQPSAEEFEGMNVYLSTSYFLGKILPSKLSGKRKNIVRRELELKKVKSYDHNIIFVLGESLTPNHMSLFGYKRETTPYLKSIADSPSFYYSRAISAGVSSDVAVAFLMNNTFGDQGAQDVFKGENCLLSLAKKAKFKTIYRSTQSNQQLRYIKNSLCPKYIDDYKDLEMIDPLITDHDRASDQLLLGELESMDLSSNDNKIIILHKRGSHSPYNKRFLPKNEIFKSDTDIGRRERNINHYDNSVYEFDLFMKRLISIVNKSKKETHVIYVSDHGQGLGESGVFGHGKLNRISAEIPFLYYFHQSTLGPNITKALPSRITHFHASLLTSELLGFQSEVYRYSENLKTYEVYGNDLDGFMGSMKINFESEK